MNRECILPNTCKDIPVTFVTENINGVDDSEFPPVNGAYFNTIVTYTMTGHTYLYDSQGVPALLNDMSSSVDDALSTTSKNPVQNKVITQALNQATSGTNAQIAEVKTQIVAEANTRAEADNNLTTQIGNVEQTLTENLDTAIAGVNTTLTNGLAGKVDKVEGKGLSTNDFTDAYQEKLAGIEAGAQVNPTNVSAFTNDAGYATRVEVETSIDEAANSVTEDFNLKLDKSVVQSIRIDDTTSTDVVNLVNGTVNLSTGATDSSEIPLPVASSDSAGVINPSIFNSIQNSAESIDAILGGAVAVSGISAEPTQADITSKWKAETGKDDLINGAKVYDQDNNKTWTYYSNTGEWYSASNATQVTIEQFTNDKLGVLQGSTNPGQLFAEPDGKGSVNGWDDAMSRITNLENNPYDLPLASTTQLGGIKLAESGLVSSINKSVASDAETNIIIAQNQLPDGTKTEETSVVLKGATTTKAGLMTSADKTKLDSVPTDAVSSSTLDTTLDAIRSDVSKNADDITDLSTKKLDKPASTGTSGQTLTLGSDGKPTWATPSSYTLQPATNSALGGIMTDKYLYEFDLPQFSAENIRLLPRTKTPNSSQAITSDITLTGATQTKAGVLTAADKTKLDNMPEFEVLPISQDPGEGSALANNKIIFIVED